MRKQMVLAGAVALAAALVSVSASATTFYYDFTSNDGGETATGALTVTPNGGGSYTATGGTLTLTGDELGDAVGAGTVFANPSAPSETDSPSGFFIYDDQLTPGSNPSITNGGLLFTLNDGGEEINIFSNGPSKGIPDGSYQLYAQNGANVSGSFSLETPEPATWAMMLVGFAALGGVMRARRRTAIAAV